MSDGQANALGLSAYKSLADQRKRKEIAGGYWCQACREVRMIHCSDPINCGGMVQFEGLTNDTKVS